MMVEKQNARLLKVLLQVLVTTPQSVSALSDDVFGVILQVLKAESRCARTLW
jgi:hypothetical protein